MSSTVLITGASQGIGKATAFLFAQNGYNVVLAARQRDRLESVAQELKSLNHAVLAIPTDVRDIQQLEELVQNALEQFSSIDVLVNNEAIWQAVQNHRPEVMVGSAVLSKITYKFFPKPIQRLLQMVFKHKT